MTGGHNVFTNKRKIGCSLEGRLVHIKDCPGVGQEPCLSGRDGGGGAPGVGGKGEVEVGEAHLKGPRVHDVLDVGSSLHLHRKHGVTTA